MNAKPDFLNVPPAILFQPLTQNQENSILKLMDGLENKIIPDEFPLYLLRNIDIAFRARRHVTRLMGFVPIAWDWINPLANWLNDKKCLEVMAGSGALSFALKEKGINVIATDNLSWEENMKWEELGHRWTDIENLDAIDAVKKYGKEVDIILMSWAYMDDTAYKVLLEMRNQNPNCQMIYIGEGWGGCTASDEFFDTIEEIEDEKFNDISRLYEPWDGLHDYLRLVK